MVIDTNSRAGPHPGTAAPVGSLFPHIDTMEVQRCYDTRAYLSAWFCLLIGSLGPLHHPSDLAGPKTYSDPLLVKDFVIMLIRRLSMA